MLSRYTAVRYCAGVAALAALGAGCYRSVRLAWADYLFRLDSESGVAHAARLIPQNAEYHARLAALEEDAGRNPRAIESALASAVAANPRLADAWLELGLRAEIAGDVPRAEMLLTRAARVDRTYSTLWTLANYYFRHNQREKFWPVARLALRIGDVRAHDPVPLFRLAWKMTRDPNTILDRAIPEVGAVQARYLEFLLSENLAPIAEAVTERVVAFGGEADLESVVSYCDRLIETGAAGRAIHAWNALCWRTLHGYRPLQPERGISLTNGDFAAAPLSHGFDWRVPSVAGVAVERAGLPPAMRISFDGRQAEVCEPLVQYVPLVPARKYRLEFRYQTDGIQPGSGLRWHISDATTGQEIAADAADMASELENAAGVRFTVPPAVSLVRLALGYRRTPGTMRIEGRVTLSAVSLRFDP
jgi:tetratricopeptide (TPR) repeat protein